MTLGDWSRAELISSIKNLTKIANAKLQKVRKGGYENYNQSFLKKYNVLTNNKVNPDLVTKKGLFRTGVSKFNKDQLIKRLAIMNEFVNNPFASAEYTEQHLSELREKWGISSNDAIKKMFDLYREYGYDNYSDSDKILTSMSKIISDAEIEDIENPGEFLEQILQDIEDDTSYLRQTQAVTEQDYINNLQSQAGILK